MDLESESCKVLDRLSRSLVDVSDGAIPVADIDDVAEGSIVNSVFESVEL